MLTSRECCSSGSCVDSCHGLLRSGAVDRRVTGNLTGREDDRLHFALPAWRTDSSPAVSATYLRPVRLAPNFSGRMSCIRRHGEDFDPHPLITSDAEDRTEENETTRVPTHLSDAFSARVARCRVAGPDGSHWCGRQRSAPYQGRQSPGLVSPRGTPCSRGSDGGRVASERLDARPAPAGIPEQYGEGHPLWSILGAHLAASCHGSYT
jgi:hypothetical protein